MAKLLGRVREVARVRHLSPRTERRYVHRIKRFVRFHGLRHPEELAEDEIAAFVSHLAVRERVAASTQNQAMAAVLFLYRDVLRRNVGCCSRPAMTSGPCRCCSVIGTCAPRCSTLTCFVAGAGECGAGGRHAGYRGPLLYRRPPSASRRYTAQHRSHL